VDGEVDPSHLRPCALGCCVGNLNKLVLEFGRVFWCDEDMFGCVREREVQRGRLYMFWNVARINAAPILVCLLSGSSAHEVETLDDPQPLVDEAMALLRRMFGEDAPDPVKAHLTRWGQDPLARGSYSFVAVGATEKGPQQSPNTRYHHLTGGL
jgi:monoamine oxidase